MYLTRFSSNKIVRAEYNQVTQFHVLCKDELLLFSVNFVVCSMIRLEAVHEQDQGLSRSFRVEEKGKEKTYLSKV